MNIINPNFELNENKNIFTIRINEYNQLIENIDKALNPARELGYEIEKFGIVDLRFHIEELSKTLRKKLEIILLKNDSKIDLSMTIPELIEDNFIFVNGKKKIPHFQLIDLPITVKENKKIENSLIVKFRSNVCTTVLYEKNNIFPKITTSIMGKRIPFSLILMCYYKDRIDEIFDINHYEDIPDMYGRLLGEIKYYFDRNLDQDGYLKILGEYFTKYNIKNKGEEVMYTLDIIPKVDVMTQYFMKKESVVEEILWAIKNGPFDDADFRYKRIRCFEYLILGPIFRSIFNLCISTRNIKQPKFNVNKAEIIQNCNVSDIVQFDFSINPVGSLTELSRISLLGPGGFSRNNVPEYLRDIHESMFGRICVVDTPDRDNCGVVENLLPNSDIDDKLQFTDKICENQPVSIPVSMVPFMEHDDQTRLQMASSQMRQAILLKNPELPMVQSGCENLYTKHTPFSLTAKEDGIVLYEDMDDDILIIKYDSEKIEFLNAGTRRIYVDNMDMMHHTIKEGERFKKDDILAESLFVNDGTINIGQNLLTGVTVYYGYNYEDGIVISERLVNEEVLSSVHFKDLSFFIPTNKILMNLCEQNVVVENDKDYEGDDSDYVIITPYREEDKDGNIRKLKRKYRPLPRRDDWIEIGEPYAKLKKVPTKDDFNTIFEEEEKLICNKRIRILECNIYVNDFADDKRVPEEYKDWIRRKTDNQRKKEDKIKDIINRTLPKKEATKFIKDHLSSFDSDGKYKMKGEQLEGIYVHLVGYYFRKIEIGDKIGNRHGNKGVISYILGEDKMPRLPNGKPLDIIINPLGIISRMNIGQLYELHLSMSLNDLKRNIKLLIKNKFPQRRIKKYLLNYIKIIDNTIDKWYIRQFTEQIGPIEITEEFIDNLTLVQAPFESITMKKCLKALEYTETPFRYKLFDPCVGGGKGDYLVNEVACGYMYFFRMAHIAEEKLAARGIGSYTKKTLQPTSGKRNQGGQRLGEMEVACMIGHDGMINLHESMTTKSDCIEAKNRWMYDTIDSGNKLKNNQFDDSDDISESVRLLNSYLTVIGINKE